MSVNVSVNVNVNVNVHVHVGVHVGVGVGVGVKGMGHAMRQGPAATRHGVHDRRKGTRGATRCRQAPWTTSRVAASWVAVAPVETSSVPHPSCRIRHARGSGGRRTEEAAPGHTPHTPRSPPGAPPPTTPAPAPGTSRGTATGSLGAWREAIEL